MAKVLIVDDDKNILEVLKLRFQSCGHTPFAAENGEEAVSLIKSNVFDAAVFDMRLGKKTGIELMNDIRGLDSGLPVIFLTAYGTISNAVEAMKNGAYSYLVKPFDHRELMAKVESAAEKCAASRSVLRSSDKNSVISKTIIGTSEKAITLKEKIAAAAVSGASVYITGESGTGKELAARMLHALSSRKDRPFVAVNSSAIPETLMESELFGYEKGAFTGADRKKKGFFEQAQGGTVFLDEISEMPPAMQTKLLRVLENREISPLGSEKTVSLDIRLVTASNKDLLEMIEKNEFRADLFYRIHVIQIELPPLRARREDIPLLCAHFLDKYTSRYRLESKNLSDDAIEKLISYDWPGNIRELENVLECAVALEPSGTIKAGMIKFAGNTDCGAQVYREAKKQFEEVFLKQLMERTKGNISKASKLSDIYRADLYDLLKKHSIDPSNYR